MLEMSVVLLSGAYLLGAALLVWLFIAMAGVVVPGYASSRAREALWQGGLRYAAGMSMLSAVVAWLGLAGLLRLWTVVPVSVALAVWGGWPRTRWSWLVRPGELAARLRGLPTASRALLALALGWALLLSANLLVGALRVDMGQDALWYHLTVPGQWIITGRLSVFSHVVPSLYPLGMEAVYAAALLVSDEVMCTLLYGVSTLVLFSSVVALSARWVNVRSALLVGIPMITLMAANCALAPVGVVNDNVAALMFFSGWAVLMDPLWDRGRRLSCSHGFLAGWLLGSSMAIKLISLGFVGPLVVILVTHSLLERNSPWRFAKLFLMLAAGALLAYLPWFIRGLLSSGNPFFPLFGSLFPMRPDYVRAIGALQHVTSLYPLTLSGLHEAVFVGLPLKLEIAATSLDTMPGMLLLAIIGALASRNAFWRLQGVILLAFTPAFFLLNGRNEVPRYFSVCYPIAVPPLVFLLDRLMSHLRPHLRGATVFALLTASAFTALRRQTDLASCNVVRWHYRPVVTSRQRAEQSTYAEVGYSYLPFLAMQPFIPADACVFLPDCVYPYFLKRQCVWSDEMSESAHEALWKQRSAVQVHEWLVKQGVSYVVVCQPKHESAYRSLQEAGFARQLPLPSRPELGGWSLWKLM